MALKRLRFEEIPVRGSHHYLHHPHGRSTVAPLHAGETIGPGLLSKILRDREIDRDELAANRVRRARYYWLLLAGGHLNRKLFRAILGWIWASPVPGG